MNTKLIQAIALNTIGAGIIAFGAGLENKTAAIATTYLGASLSLYGACKVVLFESTAQLQSQQEVIFWAQEAQMHLQEKRELLLKLEELEAQIKNSERDYESVISSLEIDAEILQQLEKAELN